MQFLLLFSGSVLTVQFLNFFTTFQILFKILFFRIESAPATPVTTTITESSNPYSPISPYFPTSEGKAKFLTRYSQNITEEALPSNDETTPVVMDNIDLRQKKVFYSEI